MIELVIATRNRKKLEEMREQLESGDICVRSLSDFPDVPEIIEDRATFAENAAKKATEVAQAVGRWSVADDSGLCVDALDGRPGIFSARYAGEPPDDVRNNVRLVEELRDIPERKRTAHYVSSIAVADPSGKIVLAEEAVCRGRILLEPRGDGGFGYDPHFLVLEYHRTFGELPAVAKRHLSHRARAFERLVPRLADRLRAEAAAESHW